MGRGEGGEARLFTRPCLGLTKTRLRAPLMSRLISLSLAFAILLPWPAFAASAETAVRLALIPPSPVTDQITLDIRAAVYGAGDRGARFEVAIYLDAEQPDKLGRVDT